VQVGIRKAGGETAVPHNDKPVVFHVILRFDIGGMEQVLVDTVNGLDDAYQHTILCLTDASPKHVAKLSKNAAVIQLHQTKPNDWRQWLRVYRIFKRENVAICHSYNISTLEYQWLAMLAGIKVRVHAEHGRSSTDPDGTYWKYLLLRKLCKPAVTSWVLVSTDLFTWAQNTIGIKSRKLRLIQNGVDTQKFNPRKKSANMRGQHWPEALRTQSRFLFGTVGRLDPVKNQGLLIKAFAQLLSRIPANAQESVSLVIIGDGSQRQYLESLVTDLDIQRHVFFLGARRDIDLLLPDLDVFVLSSDAEGLPVTLLEAMACAIPCVCTNVGGISTVLNSENGLLVTPDDVNELSNAMSRCLNDQTMSEQFGRSARQFVDQKYGCKKMVEQYRQAYSGNTVRSFH